MNSQLRACTIWLTVVVATANCGPYDPAGASDDNGQHRDAPHPEDEWLAFDHFEPDETLSIRPTIEITFNAYLDPTTFDSFTTARLRSGGRSHAGRVDYWMTRKQIRFRPYTDLEPELSYTLEWRADDVRSVTDAPLHPLAIPPRYRTDDDLEPTPPLSRPEVSWEEVESLFDAHCNDCHSDPNWQLPELTRHSLVHSRSRQADARLVEPFFPHRSYLMHKILPDYPIRRHTVQPPPWSDHEAMSLDDIERIEHWIANGAPR